MQLERGIETLTAQYGTFITTSIIAGSILKKFFEEDGQEITDEEDRSKLDDLISKATFNIASGLSFNPFQMQLYSTIKNLIDSGVVFGNATKFVDMTVKAVKAMPVVTEREEERQVYLQEAMDNLFRFGLFRNVSDTITVS